MNDRPRRGSRLGRFLPPLVVLGLAVLLVLRLAQGPDRLASRDRIALPTASVEDVRRHYELYKSDPEDRELVALAYLRLEKVPEAIEAAFGNLRDPVDSRHARDFAEKAIRNLGWGRPERFEEPKWIAPLALTALCDGGDEKAKARMTEIGSREPIQEMIRYYLAAFDRGTRDAVDAVVAGLRTRGEEMYDAPAAMAAMRPEPYPERVRDLALLQKAAKGELRQQDKLRWSSTCFALGRAEDAEANATLKELATRLGSSDNPRDKEDAAVAASGLVASGDWSEEARVLPYVDTRDPMPFLASWYARAVVWRDGRGDAKGHDRLRRIWSGPSQPAVPDLRTALATRLFLQNRLATGDPMYEDFLRDLIAPDARLPEQVVGHAARLRQGHADATLHLLRLVKAPQGVLIPENTASAAPHAAHPVITAMRAIYLYGATPP